MDSKGHKEAHAWIADIANAAMFLTRAPIPGAITDPARTIAQSARAFPLAGLAIGALTAFVLWLLTALGASPLLAAALAVTASTVLTGGLHEDGLADTVDGFGGGRTRERKLEIMRDSRIGSYGAAAIVLALLLKVSALVELDFAAVIFSAMVSRAAMTWLLSATPAARPDGLGAAAGRPGEAAIVAAMAVTLAAAVLIMFIIQTWQPVVFATLFALATAFLVRAAALRQVGGQTGDICGAMQVLTELAALAAWSIAA